MMHWLVALLVFATLGFLGAPLILWTIAIALEYYGETDYAPNRPNVEDRRRDAEDGPKPE